MHAEQCRWRAVLEYHGGNFAGWQFQPNQRTIQGEVETALFRLLGQEVRVSVSGRTDAGVHAEGQVISFLSDVRWKQKALIGGLNHFLPLDIACREIESVPLSFDPRRWAYHKEYRYVFLDRPWRSPWWEDRAWRVSHLNEQLMNEAAKKIVGKHDFSSFRAAGCQADHPHRELLDLRVTRHQDTVVLMAKGNGFLRHMVRILAGTLVEVALSRRSVDWPYEVLMAKNRTCAGITAPPQGLTLVRVQYGDGPPPWSLGGT